MTDWQPIATAPKDGTWILVFTEDHYADSCPQQSAKWISQETEYWDQVNTTTRKRRVEVSGYWHGCDGWPTHWMPLPAPPEQHI